MTMKKKAKKNKGLEMDQDFKIDLRMTMNKMMCLKKKMMNLMKKKNKKSLTVNQLKILKVRMMSQKIKIWRDHKFVSERLKAIILVQKMKKKMKAFAMIQM